MVVHQTYKYYNIYWYYNNSTGFGWLYLAKQSVMSILLGINIAHEFHLQSLTNPALLIRVLGKCFIKLMYFKQIILFYSLDIHIHITISTKMA